VIVIEIPTAIEAGPDAVDNEPSALVAGSMTSWSWRT